jgi:hypothetical protein
MTTFQILAAAFASYMLVRHGPRALRVVRGEGPRAMGMVSILNVVLAIAILAVAVKGFLRVLISR